MATSITPVQEEMYKTNWEPLLKCIQDLERWVSLPLSMLGRVSLLKMNILPRLLNHFQMIPFLLSQKTIKKVNSWFSTFIWNKKNPGFKTTVEQGGLAGPNIRHSVSGSRLLHGKLD